MGCFWSDKNVANIANLFMVNKKELKWTEKKMEITFKTARRNDSRNISTWIPFLRHFVVDFQLNKKNVENHGNTWRVLTFVHSNFPSTGIYILNLCHKNKLKWGKKEKWSCKNMN